MKSTKLLFTSFLFALTFIFSNCSKNNSVISSTEETLIRNNWAVDYYFNSQDLTSNYGSYRLLFSNTGLLVAQKDSESIMGSWSSSHDVNNNEVIDLRFTTTDANLIQLNKQWKLIDQTFNTIEFEEIEHTNPPGIFRIRKQ